MATFKIRTVEKPEYAFVTAAGIGSRLRPYTDELPKPLVSVKGRPILDYIFDSLEEYGIKRVILNTHYMSDKIEEYVDSQRQRPFEIITLYEQELLDTGGGIKTGLPYFEGKPFFALSSDSFWSNRDANALNRMAENWTNEHMDLLLMLQPLDKVIGHCVGDYDFIQSSDANKIKRSHKRIGTHMWTSVRICKPSLFDNTPENHAFSFLQIMDKAEKNNSLYGLEHNADWYHVSTSKDLEYINANDLSTLKNAV